MKKDVDIQMREWWVAELQAITKRVMAEEERRQARERRKAEKMMGEYQTAADLMDAYGCGVITENQYSKMMALLEGWQPQPGSLYEAKIELLQELYAEQKKILEDRMRWEGIHAEG